MPRKTIDETYGERKSETEKDSTEKEIRRILLNVSTPNISDAMDKARAMEGIYPIVRGKMVVGRAVTVKTKDGDPVKVVEAIDVAGKGDVIVIACSGNTCAVWGELAAASCMNRGIEGIIIDGAVRDVDDIANLGHPVFANRVVPNVGKLEGQGEINVKILCGGLEVNPRDWIVADDNGIMVLPKQRAYQIALRSLKIKEHEERIRYEIKANGKTLPEKELWLRYTDKSFLEEC